jgi:hypothetical protein
MEHENNPENIDRETTDLDRQIDHIYEQEADLDHADKMVLAKPILETKTLPNKMKRAWLQRVGPYVRAAIVRTKNRIKQRNHAITNFFQPVRIIQPATQPINTRPKRQNRAHADTFDPP